MSVCPALVTVHDINVARPTSFHRGYMTSSIVCSAAEMLICVLHSLWILILSPLWMIPAHAFPRLPHVPFPTIPLTAITTLLPATCSEQRRKLRYPKHGAMMVPRLPGMMMVANLCVLRPHTPPGMMMALSLCRGMTMILPSRPRGGTMMGLRYKSHRASWQELSCAILRSRSRRNLWMGVKSCLAWQLGECW